MVTVISSVASALITGIVAIIVCNQQHKTTIEATQLENKALLDATKEENSKTIALIEYRLGELEKKVDKHNNSVERLAILEAKFNMAQPKNQ